jgi:hypothetical protein
MRLHMYICPPSNEMQKYVQKFILYFNQSLDRLYGIQV